MCKEFLFSYVSILLVFEWPLKDGFNMFRDIVGRYNLLLCGHPKSSMNASSLGPADDHTVAVVGIAKLDLELRGLNHHIKQSEACCLEPLHWSSMAIWAVARVQTLGFIHPGTKRPVLIYFKALGAKGVHLCHTQLALEQRLWIWDGGHSLGREEGVNGRGSADEDFPQEKAAIWR